MKTITEVFIIRILVRGTMDDLFKKFYQYKKELKMTNEDIAAKTNLPLGTINRISSGKTKNPKLSTLNKLAQAFNVTLDDLLNNTGGCEPFYLDKETGVIAEEISCNQELKTLFISIMNLSSEDKKIVTRIVESLKKS